MTGWATIKKIRDFEERAAKLGFRLLDPNELNSRPPAYSTSSNSFTTVWMDEVSSDKVSLTPVDERYPCWRRGSDVFTGTIEEAKFFFQGVEFAQISDAAVGLSNDKKRARAELKHIEKMRKQEEARIKKEEQKKIWNILKHGQFEEDEEVPF